MKHHLSRVDEQGLKVGSFKKIRTPKSKILDLAFLNEVEIDQKWMTKFGKECVVTAVLRHKREIIMEHTNKRVTKITAHYMRYNYTKVEN